MQIPKKLQYAAFMALASWSSVGLASGSGAPIISYYEILLRSFGIHDHHQVEELKPVIGAVLTFVLTLVLGLLYKSSVDRAGNDAAPVGKVSVRGVVEMVLEFVHDIGLSVIGQDRVKPFLPVLFGIFLFILVSNLTGLIPGLTPSTDSINTNLVLGLVTFFVFNAAGLKEHGVFGYLKTFAGPLLVMAPIIFLIEGIGMMARPVSLALRLYGNIFGDHLVLSVFTDLTKLVLPSFLMFFGLLVACLQSFVFTLLSSIYISMAISHDH